MSKDFFKIRLEFRLKNEEDRAQHKAIQWKVGDTDEKGCLFFENKINKTKTDDAKVITEVWNVDERRKAKKKQ